MLENGLHWLYWIGKLKKKQLFIKFKWWNVKKGNISKDQKKKKKTSETIALPDIVIGMWKEEFDLELGTDNVKRT